MKPLQGVKVVDFTQAHAGSLATMILSDFGAEVIKIERPKVGDLARYWEPMKDGNSGYYVYLNRGKKSMGIDAGSAEGKEILLNLIKEADVVTENFKYGSMERLGLDYETLKKVNPEIIYASLNGFGTTGPLKENIGLDLQLQAMSGIMDRTGFPDGPPTKVGAALGDQLSGLYMATGILLSLINKKKHNEGQKVDIGILDCLISILEAAPAAYSMTGETPSRTGNSYPGISPYDVFKCNDGYVAIGISTDNQWKKFCKALNLKELAENPLYDTNESRGIYYEKGLRDEIEAYLKQHSKFEIERILREERLACGAVCTVKEAMESPQIKHRNMVKKIKDENIGGEVGIPNTIIRLEKTPGGFEEGAPRLGEHTFKYLKELGYTEEEIKKLLDKNIIQGI